VASKRRVRRPKALEDFERAQEVEDAKLLSVCPRGHALPNRIAGKGRCTVLTCCDDSIAIAAKATAKKRVSAKMKETRADLRARKPERTERSVAIIKKLMPQNLENEEHSEIVAESMEAAREDLIEKGKALGRYAATNAFLGYPEDLKGEDAERFADEKLTELVPVAVMEVERRLKLGDDDQRWQAAQQVLNSTGRGKQERSTPSTPAIIVQISGGDASQMTPWRASAQTVEGKVTDEEK